MADRYVPGIHGHGPFGYSAPSRQEIAGWAGDRDSVYAYVREQFDEKYRLQCWRPSDSTTPMP